jgi:hypothetical protein
MLLAAMIAAIGPHVVPENVVFSTRVISAPHLGHCVSDTRGAGLRRPPGLNQEGHFIGNPIPA